VDDRTLAVVIAFVAMRLAVALLLLLAAGCGRSVLEDEPLAEGPDGGGAGGFSGGSGGGIPIGGASGASGFAGAGGSVGGAGGSAGFGGGPSCQSCAGCCDAAGTCHSGDDVTACGLGGVICIDCGAIGFGCVGGACEGPPPVCGPATCAGCCDGRGLCRFGTESDACGAGGGECADCSALGLGCAGGACEGPPPVCGPGNCGGCCAADGVCLPGTANTACGSRGLPCQSCSPSGRVCTQPGSYCAYFPSCGAFTCPDGCCDATGKCRSGRANDACGTNGQSCRSCADSGLSCAPQGYCYTGPHCGPDNCAGCCNASGVCESGSSNVACGQFGKLCDNCSTKGQSCVAQVCSSGSTCPGAYSGCSPDALTPPPVASRSCSAAELDRLAAACRGTPPGPACGQAYQDLFAQNPACFDCLLQFSSDSAYARCLAPFLTAACNHDLTCALFCGNTSCDACLPTQQESCRERVFSAAGQCAPWVNGYFCAQAALSGPGAFCDFGGDPGQWIRAVGQYYCGR
jgi:hypothetical protein